MSRTTWIRPDDILYYPYKDSESLVVDLVVDEPKQSDWVFSLSKMTSSMSLWDEILIARSDFEKALGCDFVSKALQERHISERDGIKLLNELEKHVTDRAKDKGLELSKTQVAQLVNLLVLVADTLDVQG